MGAPILLDQVSNALLRTLKALLKRAEAGNPTERDIALFSKNENLFIKLIEIAENKRDLSSEKPDDDRFESPDTGRHGNRPTAIQLRPIGSNPI